MSFSPHRKEVALKDTVAHECPGVRTVHGNVTDTAEPLRELVIETPIDLNAEASREVRV